MVISKECGKTPEGGLVIFESLENNGHFPSISTFGQPLISLE
jgi:hypothetical protein